MQSQFGHQDNKNKDHKRFNKLILLQFSQNFNTDILYIQFQVFSHDAYVPL